jgi:hypothetical protein
MTTTISTANSLAFTQNVDLLVQQMTSKIMDTVDVKDFTGEGAQDVQQVGSIELDLVTSVDGDTNYGSPSHTSRWMFPKAYDKAFLIDKVSELLTIGEFKSPYVSTLSKAAMRVIDDTLTERYFGTNYVGKQGATTQAFTAGNQIAATVGAAAATGLNPEKVLQGLEVLRQGEALDDSGMDPVQCVISPKMQTDLLRFVEVASGDFASKKAYDAGTIPQGWMGCNWRVSSRLPVNGSSYRRGMMYVKSGVCLGFWQRPTPELFRDTAKKNNWACQIKMMLSASRREEAKCIELICAE